MIKSILILDEHPLIHLFVQKILKTGKKYKAKKIFKRILSLIEEESKVLGLKLVEIAVKNVTIPIILKTQKLGGSISQIPVPIPYAKSIPLAVANLVNFAKQKKGVSFENSLYIELLDASKKKGLVWNKKQQFIKQALHNRIFSHWAILQKKISKNKISMKSLLVANKQEFIEQKILENKYKN